jgi:hypothetical protein
MMKTKKELKDAYKQIQFKIGVFQIRNTVNHKVFIDHSVNLDKIWNRHRLELDFGNHRNVVLQKEWKEFGADKFQFEILGEIEQEDNPNIDYAKEAKKLAQMFIEEVQPFGDKGYNG